MNKKIVRNLLLLPPQLRVIPCRGKAPIGRQWNQIKFNYSPRNLVNTIIKYEGRFTTQTRKNRLRIVTATGYGVVCGSYPEGYLIAIDCDSKAAIETLEKLQLPKSVSYTSGRKNRRQALYYLDRPIPSFQLDNGLGIRGEKMLSVLPPSMHPVTQNCYYWLNSPQTTPIAQVTAEQIEALNPPRQSKPKSYEPSSPQEQINFALKQLRQINPDFSDRYDSWIAVGMALHSVSPQLLSAWDKWSRTSDKYQQGECEYKWQSFGKTNGRKITIGTLYYYAQQSLNIKTRCN